jgi:hypothetical protein
MGDAVIVRNTGMKSSELALLFLRAAGSMR